MEGLEGDDLGKDEAGIEGAADGGIICTTTRPSTTNSASSSWLVLGIAVPSVGASVGRGVWVLSSITAHRRCLLMCPVFASVVGILLFSWK
mmetsp:Transcript_47677/g.144159  ORF Transcript_47677/g.144159 Transcript_47677/m.144159 type:complete len:91 (-) Transcript_47677:71-343(-)